MRQRVVVVELWTGTRAVRTLRSGESDPAQAELDAIATAHVAANDGVRPIVRVLESRVALHDSEWPDADGR